MEKCPHWDCWRNRTQCIPSQNAWNRCLPIMSAIVPPHLRKEETSQKWIVRAEQDTLQKIFKHTLPNSRLKSQLLFYLPKKDSYNIYDTWRKEWINNKRTEGNSSVTLAKVFLASKIGNDNTGWLQTDWDADMPNQLPTHINRDSRTPQHVLGARLFPKIQIIWFCTVQRQSWREDMRPSEDEMMT